MPICECCDERVEKVVTVTVVVTDKIGPIEYEMCQDCAENAIPEKSEK